MATRAVRRVPASGRVPVFLPEPLEGRRLLSVALLDPVTQPRFQNPLPVPAVAQPVTPGGPHYDIPVTQFQQNLGLVHPTTGQPLSTTVWGYGGSFPGPTIQAHQDQPITVRWINDLVRNPSSDRTPLAPLLPVDTSIHWTDPTGAGHTPGEPYTGPMPIATHLHGAHVDDRSDGHPHAWYTPDGPDADSMPDLTGPMYNEVYTYPNDQDGTTLWYHDHGLGLTRLNVYAGLAGMYLLRGHDEAMLGLPSGAYEIPLVIQDRMFTADGQLYFPSDPPPGTIATYPSIQQQFFGNFILVNGAAWPSLDVEPRRSRFRMVNGAVSRVYTLSLSSGQPIHQVGTDGGLLDATVAQSQLTIAPGERADVVIDFSDPALWGQTVVFRNTAGAPFGGAPPDPATVGQVMAFKVTRPLSAPDTSRLPASLRDVPIQPLVPDAPQRNLVLFSPTDEYGRTLFLLGTATGGPKRFHDPVTEIVQVGDTEVWEIRNNTAAAHPIHIHLVQFQVVRRTNGSGQVVTSEFDSGWKDTVRIGPRETLRVVAKFDKAGEYVWHCHMLSHEDHDMMRPLRVVEPAPPAEVVGRHVFYNNSAFDGRSGATDGRDDGAIATDKQALLPMQTATFANLTSYTRGINGIILDVRNLPPGDATAWLTPADFVFKAGVTGDPANWPAAPAPTQLSVRRGAGAGSADRVTLAWPDGAIKNKWLRVQVLANSRTGLASPDVFYFGNLVGEVGNATTPPTLVVNGVDLRMTRTKVVTRYAPLTSRYDFNRDRVINSLDVAAVRANQRAALPVISAPHEMGHVMGGLMIQSMSFADSPVVPAVVPSPSTTKTEALTCTCCGAAGELLAGR